MEIEPKTEYKPREIANNGWIKNSKGNSDYYYIIKLIKAGQLRARNYCLTGNSDWWLVKGQDIINYLEAIK